MNINLNNKLKVGIDARLLSHDMNGIKRYTSQTFKELLKKTADFFLYSPSAIATENWKYDNLVIRTAHCRYRVEKMLWSQTSLPYWARKDNLDVFWGPTHRLPRFLPSNIARVVTIHDLVWKHAGKTMRSLSRLMDATLMPQAVEDSDIVVTISKSTADDLAELCPRVRSKIRVIYPGYTSFSGSDNNQIATDLIVPSPYILFVGTLEPRKNLYRLMKAFASLREANGSVSLVIAGSKGWGNVDISQWINELGLDGKVFPVGYVTDEQLSALYANSLFLAMPSLYEGFGLPIVEAMSYGKAVLTSNISSMPEVAGRASVLVDPFDEYSIAMGLRSLIDKTERSKLAAEAKKNTKRFNLQENAEKLWEVFQEAIEIRKNIMQGSG